MCMAKALDDRMHILVKQGRAPFVGSSRGHEGIQVASTAAIGPDDWLVPHYRGLANAIVRGLTMKEWMLAVFAKAGDPLSAGRNIPGGCYSYHALKIAPVSQVVASWIPKAAGIAYAAKLRGDGSVTLCTFGDGATSMGEFHEGVNFAAVHRLPIVFVCENNSYAISVPIRLPMPRSGASTPTPLKTTRVSTGPKRSSPRPPGTIRSSASPSGWSSVAGSPQRRRPRSRRYATGRLPRPPTGPSRSRIHWLRTR